MGYPQFAGWLISWKITFIMDDDWGSNFIRVDEWVLYLYFNMVYKPTNITFAGHHLAITIVTHP